MRTVGMMRVDLETGPLGLASRLADPLAGQPTVRRSVRRALSASRLDHLALLAPPAQLAAVRSLVNGLAGDGRLAVHPLDADGGPAGESGVRKAECEMPIAESRIPHSAFRIPHSAFRIPHSEVHLARCWALGCWRGGIGGACWFDELIATAPMAALAGRLRAEAIVPLSADAVLADGALIDATIALHERVRDRYRLAFCPAPPGVGVVCLAADLLSELAAARQTVGRLLAYDPANRQADLLGKDAAVAVPIELTGCDHRLLADTARGRWLTERAIARLGDSPPAGQIAPFIQAELADRAEPWPREIDLELTTDRPLADPLRPGRPLVPVRGPADDRLVDRLCQSVCSLGADDLAVTLGGFGDALCHPDALRIAEAVKQAGALAVAVRTSGLALDEAMVERLLESAVDVVVVELDAASADGYRRLKGADAFGRVVAGMTLLRHRRAQAGRPGPLVVAEMIKCPATLDEMEAFFDRWRFADEAHLAGLDDYAGQFNSPAGPGWPTCPPGRRPCLRIGRRLTVLADGVVVACEQDLAGRFAVGDLRRQTLAEIWTGPPMERLRADQLQTNLAGRPLCRSCQQWHRP